MNDTVAKRNAASGRFLLRVPPALHETLREAASRAGLSLNEYCVRSLAAPGPDRAVPEPGAARYRGRQGGVAPSARPAVLDRYELMRNLDLAHDYLKRPRVRLDALEVLYRGESWADVVRESQEAVELTLKALLRASGVDAPRVHLPRPLSARFAASLPVSSAMGTPPGL